MKHSIFAVLAALLPLSAFGQMMPDSTVQVVAYWQKGDRIVYEFKSTTTSIDKDGKEETAKASSETRIFEVIDETDSSYVLQTTYKDVFSSDMSLSVGADVINKLGESVVVKTLTNELGTVQELLNVDELTEGMKQMLPLVVDGAVDDKELKELGLTRQELIDNYAEQLCRPETITMTFMEDVAPMLNYHGIRIRTDQEYTVKQQLNNPFPGTSSSMQFDMNFWVDEELTDSTSVVIRSYMKVDNEAMLPFLREFLLGALKTTIPQNLAPEDLEKELNAAIVEANMSASLEQYSATEIHLATGWTTQYWSKRIFALNTYDGVTTAIVENEVSLADE